MKSRRGTTLVAGILLLGFLMAAPAGTSAEGSHFLRLLLAFSADEMPTPETVLQRLLEKARRADFVGEQETTLFRPRHQVSRQEVVQKGGRRRITYLSPPELKGKEIYSEGGRSLFTDGMVVPDIGLGEGIGALAKEVRGTEEVAGRLAFIIELRASAEGGPSRRIWVDAKEWVPLRWEDRDAAGNLVSKTTYTRIRFGRGVPDVVPPKLPESHSRGLETRPAESSLEEVARQVGFRVWKPQYLPPGYRYHTATIKTIGSGKQAVQAVTTTYTNDLVVITLSQVPVRAIRDAPKPGPPRQTPIGMVWVQQGFHFVLVATPPLSEEELKRIATSVR